MAKKNREKQANMKLLLQLRRIALKKLLREGSHYVPKFFLAFDKVFHVYLIMGSEKKSKKLRLGAQSFTLLNTLRDPTQLRGRQWATS